MSKPSKTSTAVHKLELSRLNPGAAQRELMGTDVTLKTFSIYLASRLKTDLADRIVSADVSRSIEEASQLTVTINDYDRSLLVSGLLNSKLDVKIDGLWFRLTGVAKSGDDLTLSFQDREICVLRQYMKWKIARRSKVTRAEFILNLIREVKEFHIPVVIPELHKIQPVENYTGDPVGTDPTQKNKGVPDDAAATVPDRTPGQVRQEMEKRGLKVKGVKINQRQITVANKVLGVGHAMTQKRKLWVVSIMVAIQESVLGMLMTNPDNSDVCGVFHQSHYYGPREGRMDVETSARMFFNKVIIQDKKYPNLRYHELAEAVQISGNAEAYAPHKFEAEKIVTAFGSPGTDTESDNSSTNNSGTPLQTGGAFFFYRGDIEDRGTDKVILPENSWKCILRLARDVNYKAFFVSGVFYYISEDQLFKQRPQFTMNEFSEGILGIDGDYQQMAKSGQLTITVRAGRWMVPPGCVVQIVGMGPWNGRWLVSEYNRSLFDLIATITLKKPLPMLPEPRTGNEDDLEKTGKVPTHQDPNPGNPGSAVPYDTKNLINKILGNPKISFNTEAQRNDIKTGQISKGVMAFMVWFANSGYSYTVWSLKTGHPYYTTDNNPSAHAFGKAIDIGVINGINVLGPGGNVAAVMDILALNQGLLGFSQLIGPYPGKCIPLGHYPQHTLDEHKNHLHIGWPI